MLFEYSNVFIFIGSVCFIKYVTYCICCFERHFYICEILLAPVLSFQFPVALYVSVSRYFSYLLHSMQFQKNYFLNLIFFWLVKMLSTIKTTKCLMIGWLMNWNESWKKSLPKQSTKPEFALGGLRKTTNKLEGITCPAWDLNWAPLKDKSGASVRDNLLGLVLTACSYNTIHLLHFSLGFNAYLR
jgi:hypothetical protein